MSSAHSIARLCLVPEWDINECLHEEENDGQEKQDVNILTGIVAEKFYDPDDKQRCRDKIQSCPHKNMLIDCLAISLSATVIALHDRLYNLHSSQLVYSLENEYIIDDSH